MIKITTGVVSRWTRPSLGQPVLSASLVVALTEVVAMAVAMVMEVMVVSIDRPPSRWVSWGSQVWPLDPSGGDVVCSPKTGPAEMGVSG